MFDPRKKCLLYKLQPKHGHKNMKLLPSRGFPPFPGTEQAVPARAPFHAPRSPSSPAAPLHSPVRPRAAPLGAGVARSRGHGGPPVEGGRGVVVRTREVPGRAGALRGVLKLNIF